MSSTNALDMNFCRRCGTPLQTTDNHIFTCANQHTIYANASPTVGIFFITPENQIILSERGIQPHKGMLDSFGGFVDGAESFEQALERELQEELSLQPGDYETPRYLTSAIGYYPYGGEVLTVLSALFWARLTTTAELVPHDDVAAIKTVPLHSVDLALMHDDDVRAGIIELRRLFPDTNSQDKVQ